MEPYKPEDEPAGGGQTNQGPNELDSVHSQPSQPISYSNSPAADNANSENPQINNTNPSPSPDTEMAAPRTFQSNSPPTVVGNFEPNIPPPPKSNKKKKLFISAGLAVAVVGLAAGFVFGYYIPNQPDSVYRTGVNRSGDTIHKMILESTETEKLEQIKKSEFEGSLEITSDQGNINGSFNIKSDPTKSDTRLDVSFKEKTGPEQKYALKLLTELQDGKRFPDVYFQLSGIKALELDAFASGISDYDGKWIAVEAEYLETLGSGFLPPEEKKNKENVSAEDVAELIRTVSEVNNEYLFSTDADKAVLENREYLGKEKTAEGINAFHYKVGINRENAVTYCKAISDRVLSTRAAKKFMDADDKAIEEQKKSANEDCDDSGKDVKENETFDMWVDTKYKIIHKFRIYGEQDKKDKYTDIGQIYTGGDELQFFVLYHEDKDNLNIKFTLDVDLKTVNSKAELTASQEGSSGFKGRGSINTKPYAGEINTEKPAGAIPISEILRKFGYDPTSQSGIRRTYSPQEQEVLKKCSQVYEDRANNDGRGQIPAECR